MTEILISLSAAALVTAVSMALLLIVVSRLGRALSVFAALQLLGLVVLKFAVLGFGFKWMSGQAWFKAPAAAVGATLILAALAIWKGRPEGTKETHV